MDLFPSLFPLEKTPPVSDEAFNIFHSIDRELYARLIRNLGREPLESMKVMAFWLWLEREGGVKILIQRMLSLPPVLVNQIANETAMCLKCVETDEMLFPEHINVLPQLMSVSFRFFHENRVRVVNGVSKIITTVCLRAFKDILQRVLLEKAAASFEVGESSTSVERRINNNVVGPMMYNPHPAVPPFYHHHDHPPLLPHLPQPLQQASRVGFHLPMGPVDAPQPLQQASRVGFHAPILPVDAPQPLQQASRVGFHAPMMPVDALHQASRIGFHAPMVPVDVFGNIPAHMLAAGGFPREYEAELQQRQMDELGDMLSRNLDMDISGDQSEEVLPEDRTIFLTFSKGYPTSEAEVRNFFTKRFGDFIEDLIMQEVEEGEQVLYARMVARSVHVINPIVRGNKAKYSINGKHVWARKYVKRQQQQQQQMGASSSTMTPPRVEDPSPSKKAGL